MTSTTHRLYLFGSEKLRAQSIRTFERIQSQPSTNPASGDGVNGVLAAAGASEQGRNEQTTTRLQIILAENVDGIKVSDKDALLVLMDPTQPSSSYPLEMYQSLRAFTNCKRAYFIASDGQGVTEARKSLENARQKWNDALSNELNTYQEISCTAKSASEAICKLETWLHSDVATPLPNAGETKSLEDNLSWFLSNYKSANSIKSSIQVLPSTLEPPLLKFSIQDMSNLPTKAPAKLCVWRTEDSIQLCVRCDQEELREEGGGPVEDVLWNTATSHLYSIISALKNIPMIPYVIEVVPFGSPFYSKVVEEEQVYRLEQILSWLESDQDTHDFTVKDPTTGDLLYASLQITNIFPGFRPICLEDIRIRLCQGRQRERANRKSSSPVQRTTTASNPLSVNFTSDSVLSSPSKRRMSDVCGPRGRRVSFGHVLVEDANKVSIDKVDGNVMQDCGHGSSSSSS